MHLSRKLAFLILLAVGLIVYLQVFFNGFVGDDTSQIYNTALVNSFFDLPKVFLYHHVVLGSERAFLSGYYKPLMLLYFYFIRLVFGLNPFFYHAPQVTLIIVNSFLVFLLFSKFFKYKTSVVFAILFLVHPINQETAAYVSNIQDVLFFFFGMIALLFAVSNWKTPKKEVFIGIFLLLSLLSKETGILFLMIILIYKFLFQKKSFRKSLFVSGLVLGVYSIIRFSSKTTAAFWIEPAPMAKVSLIQRFMHMPLLFFYYIKTFFYPSVLSFNQQWIITQFNFYNFFLPLFFGFLFIFIVFYVLYRLYRRKSRKRVLCLFFVIWFLLGMIPHLQILPLDATVATRWFYFSSVGILGIFAILFEFLEVKFYSYSRIIFVCLIFVCLILGIRTMARNIQWKNAFVLYSTDSEISKSTLLENNLGDEYFKKGDTKNAYIHFTYALQINPNLWIVLNNMGIFYEKQKKYSKAYDYYLKAWKNGHRLPIAENIARILFYQEKYYDCSRFTRNELKEYPLSAKLWLTQALADNKEGKISEALYSAQKSFSLSPDPITEQVVVQLQSELK